MRVVRDPVDIVRDIDEAVLGAWLRQRRWFASKARELARAHVVDALTLRTEDPATVLAIVEATFHTGAHELYQVVFEVVPPGAEPPSEPVASGDAGVALCEALADPRATGVFGALLREGAVRTGADSRVTFHEPEGGAPVPVPDGPVHLMPSEQSNSSVVFDRTVILKCFRRLEPGENPELEMLRFLAARGFDHVPELVGWYDYSGPPLYATLGVAQRFVSRGRDGWEMALELLERDPDLLVTRLHGLGRVIGALHTELGSDPLDPDFAPEEKGREQYALLVATLDQEILQAFDAMPEDDPVYAPIAGRSAELRDRLQALSRTGVAGRAIRTHGDLHLAQTLLEDDGRWVILDFEGEPARPLRERRLKRSPLRDLAAMLRSVSYAAWASELQRGVPAPAGWEERARAALGAGYLETVDAALLPPSTATVGELIAVFELEKAIYELQYERNNRPDWVAIPVAGIARLLDDDGTA